jgi:polyhydroxyalkanoate synthase
VQFIEDFYKENLLIKNKLRIDSQRVDLRKIRSPLLNILARYDHIVPTGSSKALKSVYSGSDYEEIIFPSTHVGLSASREAHKKLWPKVCKWLQARR